ncbi:MAG: Fe-S cluster assembly protein SufD [Armatimonadetes bacterium]|nr:Fe-S cluster assembly protein SufD [Armatimonadota bacterium]
MLRDTDTYIMHFDRFGKELAAQGPSSLLPLRREAMAHFTELGFPTTRHEEWRYTSVAPITRIRFQPAVADGNGLTQAHLPLGRITGCRLVFVNGRYASELSTPGIHAERGWTLPRAVKAGSLAAALKTDFERVETHLARYAAFHQHPFVALNTALMEDGAFLHIPRGVIVEEPIHLVFIATRAPSGRGEPVVSHPRTLIVAEENSLATVIETYAGPDGDVYFTNAVTEIVAGENAVLDHYKVQQESEAAFHIATLHVQQARSSTFSSHSISLGGALVRNDVRAVLDGPGSESTLNGLYVARGQQHVDNHTVIDHAKSHCNSHELYKGILDGRATGVFNGKIFVRPGAQKTDARQTNQNLLLSQDAVIDTKPQLEIFADDVRCTHGATVGQLDEDAIFYLRSRGIGVEEARGLLTYAFASDVLGQFKIESLRTHLEELLHARLLRGERVRERR